MDIEQIKKFIKKKIESDNISKEVRNVIKITEWQKQDSREGFKESFKPLIESQEKVSEEINKQKKETLDQLKANQEAITKNQLALTDGIRLALRYGNLPEGEDLAEGEGEDLAEGEGEDKDAKNLININLEKEFNDIDIKNLTRMNLLRPKEVLYLNDEEYENEIKKSKKIIKEFNGKRASISKKKMKKKKKKN